MKYGDNQFSQVSTLREQVNQTRVLYETCPHCGARVQPANMGPHIKKAHASLARSSQPSPSPVMKIETEVQQKPPFQAGQAPLSPGNLVALLKYLNSPQGQTDSVKFVEVKCLLCEGMVKTIEMIRHLADGHNVTLDFSSGQLKPLHKGGKIIGTPAPAAIKAPLLSHPPSPPKNKPLRAKKTPRAPVKIDDLRLPILKPTFSRSALTREFYDNMVKEWHDSNIPQRAKAGASPAGTPTSVHVNPKVTPTRDVAPNRGSKRAQPTPQKTAQSYTIGRPSGSTLSNRQKTKSAGGVDGQFEQDGSKGLGHFRRESNGQFGSYPLHDDYSDESDAD